jgi:flagellar assembly protein FliH
MNDTSRSPQVLRNVDIDAPSKLLSRPHRAVPKAAARPASQAHVHAHAAAPVATVLPGPESSAEASARGHQEGYETGMREGLKEAERKVAEHLQAQTAKIEAQAQAHLEKLTKEHAERLARLDSLLAGLNDAMAERLAELEPAAVSLAYEAVCKLLGPKAARAETVGALVAHGVQQLRSGTLLGIRLHPADLALLSESPERQALALQHHAVQWEADAAAPRGSCTLVTDRGSLDASLGTQLERLRALWSEGDAA